MTGASRRGPEWWSRVRAGLRQRRHHRAFRIADPRWDTATRARLRALTGQLAALAEVAATVPEPTGPADPELAGAELAKAATSLWRARRKFLLGYQSDSREFRQVKRLLDAAEESLADAGVRIRDHDGEEYDTGFLLEPLDVVPKAGLAQETVLETIRPSIYLHGRCVQVGQVIVGRPAEPDPDHPTEDDHARHR